MQKDRFFYYITCKLITREIKIEEQDNQNYHNLNQYWLFKKH